MQELHETSFGGARADAVDVALPSLFRYKDYSFARACLCVSDIMLAESGTRFALPADFLGQFQRYNFHVVFALFFVGRTAKL